MERAFVDLRDALASHGRELLPAQVEEIVNLLADIAELLDGTAILDLGDDAALYVEKIAESDWNVEMWDYSPAEEEFN